MATSDHTSLDELFDGLERMPVPEGYKAEIVEGSVFMSPQRFTHWDIIRRLVRALEDEFGMDALLLSDVRVDFPGHLNGFAPDVAKLHQGAQPTWEGDRPRWHHEDVEFVAEVISRGTGRNDYGKKLRVYAEAEVPLYLVVDPYVARCHTYSGPENGEFKQEIVVAFGEPLDLRGTVLDMVLDTSVFPKDAKPE